LNLFIVSLFQHSCSVGYSVFIFFIQSVTFPSFRRKKNLQYLVAMILLVHKILVRFRIDFFHSSKIFYSECFIFLHATVLCMVSLPPIECYALGTLLACVIFLIQILNVFICYSR
jgi:hypothetical protein